MKSILEKFNVLGLSEYEGRAYLSLLHAHPATAYEVSKGSGIPTSKIYHVLGKLVARGMAAPLSERKGTRYMPLEPEEFLRRQSSTIGQAVDSLRKDLGELSERARQSSIWNITDSAYLFDKAKAMIAEARQTVLLSLWKEDFGMLEPALLKARKRKVRIAAIHFGTPQSRLQCIYAHPIEDTIYREKGWRGIVIVRDSVEVLTGTLFEGGRTEGAWSANQGFVTLAEDYIKHDIYIMKIVRRFDADLVKTFGAGYVKLRDIFSDKEGA